MTVHRGGCTTKPKMTKLRLGFTFTITLVFSRKSSVLELQCQFQGMSPVIDAPRMKEIHVFGGTFPTARLPYRNTACINKCAAYSVNTGVVPIR